MGSYVKQLERSKTMTHETARERWNSKAWVRWMVGILTPLLLGVAVWLASLSTRVSIIESNSFSAVSGAALTVRMDGHKEQLDRMEGKLDKLIDKLVDREINQRRAGGGKQ